jgi:hypothetical protein
MNELKHTADYVAAQSDRWMFVALLIIGLLVCIALWRWMVADREITAKRLTEVTDRHIAQSERLAEVVANNTAALHESNAVHREVKTIIELCRIGKHSNER